MTRTLALLFFFLLLSPAFAIPEEYWTSLSLSPHQTSFMTGSRAGSIFVWDTDTGEVRKVWSVGRSLPVVGCRWEDDESPRALYLLDGSSWSFDRSEKPHLMQDREAQNQGRDSAADWILRAPLLLGSRVNAGEHRFEGTQDGLIREVDSAGKPLRSWKAHEGAVIGLVWIEAPNLLLSAGYDGGLALWQIETGKLRSRL